MLSDTSSPYEPVADKAFLGLCVFSVVNPLLAQAAPFFFSSDIAGLNITQWFQGLCLPLILLTLPKLPRSRVAFSSSFSRLLWAFIISLGLFHLRLLATNRLPADFAGTERMVYFKIIFALLLWYYASRLVQSYESAQRLLQWILFGASISAVWIFICYFFGLGSANYASVGIRATAGSEGVSSKAIAGFLLPAAGGAMFFSLRDGSYQWAMCASLLVAALFVTFDRSAQVSLIVALSWMTIWWFVLARPKPCSRTILLFLCILLVLGGIYYICKGGDELTTRWTRDFDRGEVGSGRGTFYVTAWNWFWNESRIMDFLFGMGYANIYDLMHSTSGLYVHTHSDLFDMLVAGGIVGLLLYFFLFYTVGSLAKGLPVGSMGFGILSAVLLSFGVTGFLTGLMTFPHTLYVFGTECFCIRVLVAQEGLDLIPPVDRAVEYGSPDSVPSVIGGPSSSQEHAGPSGADFDRGQSFPVRRIRWE